MDLAELQELYRKHLAAPGELGDRLRGTGMQGLLKRPSEPQEPQGNDGSDGGVG